MSDVKTLQSDGIPLNIKDQTARNIIATPYDPTSGTYGAGDVCINGNQGYKALVDISTPEAFDPTKWEPTTLGELYTELKSNLSHLQLSEVIENYVQINSGVSYVDATYNFEETYDEIPKVMACLRGATNYMQNVGVITISSITKTSVTIRVYRQYGAPTSAGMSPGFYLYVFTS